MIIVGLLNEERTLIEQLLKARIEECEQMDADDPQSWRDIARCQEIMAKFRDSEALDKNHLHKHEEIL